MTHCTSEPGPASLSGKTPDWLKPILQEASPGLRAILYDMEVYYPKSLFEKHKQCLYNLLAAFEVVLQEPGQGPAPAILRRPGSLQPTITQEKERKTHENL